MRHPVSEMLEGINWLTAAGSTHDAHFLTTYDFQSDTLKHNWSAWSIPQLLTEQRNGEMYVIVKASKGITLINISRASNSYSKSQRIFFIENPPYFHNWGRTADLQITKLNGSCRWPICSWPTLWNNKRGFVRNVCKLMDTLYWHHFILEVADEPHCPV